MSDDFGTVLRYLRERADLSLAELGARTYTSKAQLGHVEKGIRRPTLELAQACDKVLGTGPLLVMLLDRAAGGDDNMRRRALLEHVGLVAAGAVTTDHFAEVVRHGLLGDADVDDWDALVTAYARDFVLAPSDQYGPALLADLMLLRHVRRSNPTADLDRAGACLANFYGLWLGNRGDLAAAHRWYRSASTLADHSGDIHLANYIRGRTAARGTYEGATVRQTEIAIEQIITSTAGTASIGTLEALCAEAHLAGLIGDRDRGRGAVRGMRDVAAALPAGADVWSMAAPEARTALLDAFIECRTADLAAAQRAVDEALPLLADWPMWEAEVHQYWARALITAGDLDTGVAYGLAAAQRVPHAARVIGVAVRDVVDHIPAGYGSDHLDELRRYASPDPGPWETIR